MKNGKGIICVGSHSLGRYRGFDRCLSQLVYPEGSIIHYAQELSIIRKWNRAIRKMQKGEYEWIWIVGDDHLFGANILMQLLSHDVGVIVPLCVSRRNNYHPYLFEGKEANYRKLGWQYLEGKSGLIDISGYTTSNTGMLIRKSVIEKLNDPWFEYYKDNPELLREDVTFCEKLAENDIKLYMDLNTPMAHITHMAIWPCKKEGGEYGYYLQHPWEMFPE